MLSISERQQKLKDLGLYNDAIDGIEGPNTKKAYLALQKKYFTRAKDKDGKYGSDTEKLLISAWNCRDLKYFKLQEFKCQCGGRYCTGYPAVLDYDLVHNADKIREYVGGPMTITSGLRCAKHNSAVGGAILSRHKSGKAFDFTSTYTNKSLDNRKNVIDFWINNGTNARYGYCNGYYNNCGKTGNTSWKTMGAAVHLDVK